jgi:NADH-quinone oxidoreductase subunit N
MMLLFYTAAYAFTNIGAFLVVEAMAVEGGDDGIGSFDGLAQRTPWLALCMLLFLLSLGGIPFVIGFWAKLYVFVAAWQQGLYGLVVAGAVLAVVALFYYMRVARAMYMNQPRTGARVPVKLSLGLPIVVCVLGVVGFGLAPSLVLDEARSATRPFFANMEHRAHVAAVAPNGH